jgi:molecular chaperone GrpE
MHSVNQNPKGASVPGEAVEHQGESPLQDGHKAGHEENHPKIQDQKHGHDDHRKLRELEQKLKDTEAKYEEMLDTARRMKAEYENSRKRSDAQYLERFENEKVTIMKEFILVYDNLERAAVSLGCGTDAGREEWKKGLDMVLKQFKSVLARFGVSEIDPVSSAFDPNEHEALQVTENSEVRSEMISAVLEKGYRLNTKIIRHAKVRVDRPKAGPAPEEEKKTTTPVSEKGNQEDSHG